MAKDIACLEVVLSQRMDFLKALIDERQEIANKALDLYNAEMQRRLELLNGEAARIRELHNTYLPREIYDQNLHTVSDAIAKLQIDYAQLQGRGQVISALVSFGISLVVAAFSIGGARLFH